MKRLVVAVLAVFAIASVCDGFRTSEEGDSLGAPVLPTDNTKPRIKPPHNAGDDETKKNVREDQLLLHVLKDLVEKKKKGVLNEDNLVEELKRGLEVSDEPAVEKRAVSTVCNGDWDATSTMCVYSDDLTVVYKGVTQADKTAILQEHNNYRSNVSPPASGMQKMYWSSELEALAQKWAQVCASKPHDENEERVVKDWGIAIGQNAAFGHSSWKIAIAGWHSEVNAFTYGKTYDFTNWFTIAHYTQVVRDKATSIGCGFAMCGSTPRYICNYAFGNPYLNELGFPYAAGGQCSQCPGKCNNGLCDCNGLICKNGGVLNPMTCTCTCSSALWTGSDCGTKDTSNCQDAFYCTNPQPYGYLGLCPYFSNVPVECPKMCGVC